MLDGRVQAIAQVGHTIVVGGDFTQVKLAGGQTLGRTDLFAFDAVTGAISTTFAPSVSGGSVFTLTPAGDGASVFVGGRFTDVNGHAHDGLVKLTVADGSVDSSFDPQVGSGGVTGTALSQGRLFAAGAFTTIGGVARTGLAELDPTTGAVDSGFDFALGSGSPGHVEAAHVVVSPNGRTLLVTGRFGTVDGQPRSQIAMIALTGTTGALTPWSTAVFGAVNAPAASTTPHCDNLSSGGNIRDLDFSPNGAYFVVGTTGGPALDCDSVVRFETARQGLRQQPTWVDHTGGDSITQIAVTGTAIYAGGHQRWMENSNSNGHGSGGIPRAGVAALDPVNGMPFSWNPGRKPRGTGVYGFLATSTGLWIGGDSTYTAGEYHPRLAFFPTAGGTHVAHPVVPALSGRLGTVGRAGLGVTLVARGWGGRHVALGTNPTWKHASGAFVVNHSLYAFTHGGGLIAATFTGHGLGPVRWLPLNGIISNISNVMGAFYSVADGRLYYAVRGDSRLYSRKFEPQDGLLGGDQEPVAWLPEQATALTRVGSRLVYVDNAGSLDAVSWAAHRVGRARTVLVAHGAGATNWGDVTGLFPLPR